MEQFFAQIECGRGKYFFLDSKTEKPGSNEHRAGVWFDLV